MNTQAKTADYLQSLELLSAFSADYIEQVHSIERLSHSNPWSQQLLVDEFNNKLSLRLCLIDSAGTLVAYIFNHLIEDELHILNLSVSPKLRRLGIGRHLLEQSLHFSKRHGAKRALLEVRPSNVAAVGLYRKLGFKIVAKRKAYYRDNKEDALMLEADFTKDLVKF